MPAEPPQIARPRYRIGRWLLHWRVGVAVRGAKASLWIDAGQQPVQLDAGEPEHIEINHRLVADAGDLGRQQRLVPAGVQRDLVIGQAQCPGLCRREMAEAQHRHRRQPQPLGRQYPAVAGNQHAIGVDQHWIDEAELADAVRNLPHLGVRMGAGVFGIGNQHCQRQVGNDEIKLHRPTPPYAAPLRRRSHARHWPGSPAGLGTASASGRWSGRHRPAPARSLARGGPCAGRR